MQYLGDFAEDATVYIPFNTFSSDDPSASVTITNLADADVKVHKDGSTTQIVTDGATVAIDFDSITGNHLITIDTSVHADYSTGSDYLVRIEGTTVDGATVNAWVGHFSIQNRYMRGTDSAATAAELAKVPKSDGTASWNATALAAINAEADTAISDASLATSAALATVDSNVDAILADTGTDGVVVAAASKTGYSLTATTGLGNQTANITGNLSGSVGSVTGNVGGNVTGSVGSLATQAKADVNAEVVDTLNTDTYAEPAQGAPGATISLAAKIGFLYKAWRNKSTQNATTYSLYNDDTTTVDHKATVSDDGTTATKGEVATGP